MIKPPTLQELNAMSVDERKVALANGVGQMFSQLAQKHVTWIWWTTSTADSANILGHGTAFLLDRGNGPLLVTAAHVYRQYLTHQKEFGQLYCQIGNTHVQNLSRILVACGNRYIPLGEPDMEPDIATFRMNDAAVNRLQKTPVMAVGAWPRPPDPDQSVMFAGYPGHERKFLSLSEIDFGFHTGITGVRLVTDRQVTMLIEREYLVGWTKLGVPPQGYGLGGISGGPLLVPEYGPQGWFFRLCGVISESPGPRPSEEVIFEMIAADRAEFILKDGTLAKAL